MSSESAKCGNCGLCEAGHHDGAKALRSRFYIPVVSTVTRHLHEHGQREGHHVEMLIEQRHNIRDVDMETYSRSEPADDVFRREFASRSGEIAAPPGHRKGDLLL